VLKNLNLFEFVPEDALQSGTMYILKELKFDPVYPYGWDQKPREVNMIDVLKAAHAFRDEIGINHLRKNNPS